MALSNWLTDEQIREPLQSYFDGGHVKELDSSIQDQVLNIAERGRSLGAILISAQQFMSRVYGRVTGNAAALVVGGNGSAELSAPAYRFLEPMYTGT